MKTKIHYTAILFLAGMIGHVHAQQIEEVCTGEEVICTLNTPEHVSVQWQHSVNGMNYSDIQNETRDSLVIDSAADHQFYRAMLSDSNCAAYYSDVHELIINPLPELHVSGINDMYCANDDPVHLNLSPGGGTLNGPGITDTVFDPSSAGIGTHNYTFEYTDTNGCFADTQFNVEVNPLPVVFIGGLASDYCLADSVTEGLSGNPQGGTFSGQAVLGDSVQTWFFGSGTYGVSYSYTDSMGCTAVDSATYEVVPEPSVAGAGQDTTTTSTSVQLDADTPATGSGSWSIASGSGGSFANTSDPQTNFSGLAGNTYELVWTVSNPPCASTTDTVTVEFTGSPLPFMVCDNETIYVHPTDNHTAIPYGCSGTIAGADDDFNGEQNTADVVSSCPPPTAANVCDTLTAFGHNDWYLPAYEELDCLRNNAASIGGFSNDTYWASTEGSGIFTANARYRTFPSGVSGYGSKTTTRRIRCVRKN